MAEDQWKNGLYDQAINTINVNKNIKIMSLVNSKQLELKWWREIKMLLSDIGSWTTIYGVFRFLVL